MIRHTHFRAVEPEDLEQIHAELGLQIDSRTAATRWRGERMDYELGVWVLCNQANRARRTQNDVGAGTSTAQPLVIGRWPEEEDGEWWKPGYGERADNDASAEVEDVPAGTSDTKTSDVQTRITVPWPEEEYAREW